MCAGLDLSEIKEADYRDLFKVWRGLVLHWQPFSTWNSWTSEAPFIVMVLVILLSNGETNATQVVFWFNSEEPMVLAISFTSSKFLYGNCVYMFVPWCALMIKCEILIRSNTPEFRFWYTVAVRDQTTICLQSSTITLLKTCVQGAKSISDHNYLSRNFAFLC